VWDKSQIIKVSCVGQISDNKDIKSGQISDNKDIKSGQISDNKHIMCATNLR